MVEVLRAVTRDEAAHARLCWHLAEELLPRQTQAARDELGIRLGGLLELLRRSASTAGMSPVARAQARRVRAETAQRGLGALPPDVGDALVERTLGEELLPRLAALGVVPC